MRRQALAVNKKAAAFLFTLSLAALVVVFMCLSNAAEVFENTYGSTPLRGLVIVVDAGHGGYDSGAVGAHTGVLEKELNLAVALKLESLLTQGGASVVMTRTEDVELCPPWTEVGRMKEADMQARATIIDECGADMVISVHMNKFSIARYSGAQCFWLQGGGAEGETLARQIQQALIEGIDDGNGRKAKPGDYYILRMRPASVLVECGFLSNRAEEELLCTEEYQDTLAWCIYSGVVDYAAQAGKEA